MQQALNPLTGLPVTGVPTAFALGQMDGLTAGLAKTQSQRANESTTDEHNDYFKDINALFDTQENLDNAKNKTNLSKDLGGSPSTLPMAEREPTSAPDEIVLTREDGEAVLGELQKLSGDSARRLAMVIAAAVEKVKSGESSREENARSPKQAIDTYRLRADVEAMIRAKSPNAVREDGSPILVNVEGESSPQPIPRYDKATHGGNPSGFIDKWYAVFNKKGSEVIFLDEIRIIDPALYGQIRYRQQNFGFHQPFAKASERTDAIIAKRFGNHEEIAKARVAIAKRELHARRSENRPQAA
jgi:hypothetical protein